MKKSTSFIYYFFFVLITLIISSCDNNASHENPEVVTEAYNLPLISINTNGETIIDEPKINAQMSISHADTVFYDGNIGIEIRGASSQSFPKKSYGLETRDAANEDLSVSLFNMPEEEDWIFYGPYSDKSLIRNRLIYDLAREIGRYSSRCEFAELTINHQFKGLYVFMEKLKRDKGRIDINKLNADENSGDDLTGGYILKIDKTAGSNLGEGYNNQNSFESTYDPLHATASQSIHFLYEYPKAEDITAEQKNYISTYITSFENALAAADFKDPNTGYAPYIDVNSFIDFFLLNELSNNVDGYRLSTFMYKDKKDKLVMGPIWDFNLAFGNADYCGGGDTNVWAYRFNERCSNDYWQVPFWWERLLQDPNFVSQLKLRWNELKGSAFSESQIIAKIDDYTAILEKSKAIEKNFLVWPVLGTYVWPNNYVGTTYDEEITYLKDWIHDRILWLDGAINGL